MPDINLVTGTFDTGISLRKKARAHCGVPVWSIVARGLKRFETLVKAPVITGYPKKYRVLVGTMVLKQPSQG